MVELQNIKVHFKKQKLKRNIDHQNGTKNNLQLAGRLICRVEQVFFYQCAPTNIAPVSDDR